MRGDVVSKMNLSITNEEREVLERFYRIMNRSYGDIDENVDTYEILEDIALGDFTELERKFDITLEFT